MARTRKLLSIDEYKSKMKNKYEKKLKVINDKLLMTNSFSRGELLYKLLYDMALPIESELKYYLFLDWWTSIDSFHEEFDGEDIRQWIKDAKVGLDLKHLTIKDDGFVEVYRGINEYSNGWNSLSWTTDKRIALKFAWGARVRHKCNEPYILKGGVSLDFILGIINDRNESEILCDLVEQKEHYDVKELLEVEEKLDRLTEKDEKYSEVKKRYDELLKEFDMPVKKDAKEEEQELINKIIANMEKQKLINRKEVF